MRVFLVCLGALVSAPVAAEPCGKRANAKPLVAWKPPAGCSITAPAKPELVTNGAKVFDCKGVEHGFDFAKHRLLVQQRTLSPATQGVDAYDDGKTITLVSRQVKACPTDPQPMPVPSTIFFLVDPKGARTFAEATCDQARKCP